MEQVRELNTAELDVLIAIYPWFTTARRARVLLSEKADPALVLQLMFRATVPHRKRSLQGAATVDHAAGRADGAVGCGADSSAHAAEPAVDTATRVDGSACGADPAVDPATGQAADPADTSIIERFLRHGDYRIVPDDSADDALPDGLADVGQAVDPGLATEELAEIYRAQGLDDEAEKIYRALKLRNS
jgi:hypothetical protein